MSASASRRSFSACFSSRSRCFAAAGRISFQPLDDGAGVDLLLDIYRRRIDIEVGLILGILAPPDKLRVKIGIARIAQLDRPRLVLLHKALLLSRGDHRALGGVVLVVFNVLRFRGLLGHVVIPLPALRWRGSGRPASRGILLSSSQGFSYSNRPAGNHRSMT